MKKLLVVGLISGAIGIQAYLLSRVDATPAPKVFVCKYVGTPGEDERLQTGQNPISVSSNAIKDFQGVGSYFNDAHGRSYVLAIDEGQEEPDVSECPQPEPPEEEEPPVTPPEEKPDEPEKPNDGFSFSKKVKPNPIVPLSEQRGGK